MNVRILVPALVAVVLAMTGCGGKEDRAATYLERAQAAFDQGDLIKAQLDAKNALQILPNNYEASYLLAEIAEKENRPQDMVAFLRRSVEINPNSVEAQVKMGRIWAAANRIEEARDAVTAIETADPGNLEGKVLGAIVLMREGKLDEARALGREVLEKEPRNISALAFLASSWQRDDIEKSLGYLGQAINYEPENQSLRVVKVSILQSQGRLEEAEQELRDLISRFPEENAYRYGLARYLVSVDRKSDAEQVLRNLVQADPEDLTAKLSLAQFLGQQGNADGAVALLQQYIEEEPEIYQFRFALGQTHAVMRADDKAREVYRDIMARDGKNVHGLSARTKLAALEFSRGDRALGEQLITEVLAEEPGNPDALTMRASVSLSNREFDDAIGDLRNVLRADPTRENAQLLLGKAYIQGGQNALAIEALQNLVEAHPKNADARKDLARLLVRASRWDDVRSVLEEGVRQQPNDLAISRLYIDSLLRAEDWPAAEAQAQRILDMDPTKALGHYVKGRVEQASGNYEQSVNSFQVALDIDPESAESLTSMVRSFMALKDNDRAVTYLESFVAANPTLAHGVSLLGEMQARTGDWASAEASNLRALDLQESWLPSYRNLIGVYLRNKELDKATGIVERGLAASPGNSELLLLEANILEQNGDFARAIANYDKILTRNPNLAVAANNYIALVADHQNDADTLAKAKTFSESFDGTDNPIFQDTVGWMNYRMGNFNEARKLLESAVDRAGQLPQLRYHLGMTYFKLDRLADARRELEAALAGDNPTFTGVETARETLSQL
ncbi:MAG: tetratricopeptide repeat protein [Gammaproteobacteria bacterium]